MSEKDIVDDCQGILYMRSDGGIGRKLNAIQL